MSNTWKTPKGTTLYLLDLRGKPYLPVAERLIWFREEKPNYTIETQVNPQASECLSTAWIKDETGRLIAMAHKFENKQGFPDFIEKSETGAIGRALAMCGYGTQFCADELDEGERIVDSPANRPVKEPQTPAAEVKAKPIQVKPLEQKQEMQSSGDFICHFGKFKGKSLKEIDALDISESLKWLKTKAKQDFRDSQKSKEFLFWADAYLKKNPTSDVEQVKKEMPKPPPGFVDEPWPEEIPF